MKAAFLILLLGISPVVSATDTPAKRPSYLGMFSNGEGEFDGKALILDENGKGCFLAAIYCIPVLWKHDMANNEFTLTGPAATDHMKQLIVVVRFDPSKREFTIVDPKISGGSGTLRHVSDDTPQELRDMIKSFDGTIRGK